MAAAVQLSERNGVAPGTLTPGVQHMHYGSVDAANLDDAANPVVAGTNSFEQWTVYDVTGMGGSVAIKTLRVWSPTSRPAGIVYGFNGHTSQAAYDTTKKTVYATPITGTANTPNSVPSAQPGSGNLGIAGSLVGQFVAPGISDWLVSQMQIGAGVLAGFDPLVNLEYDEVG